MTKTANNYGLIHWSSFFRFTTLGPLGLFYLLADGHSAIAFNSRFNFHVRKSV